MNWTLIGHALKKLPPYDHFEKVRHGGGVWAPSIRYHNNEFYIYYPDPDFGIYLVKAKNINGPWTEPLLVEAGKGLIDPCPLWDEDGKVYLVHADAGSRAGIKSIIVIKELNKEGTKVITEPVLVYDGHEKDPTIEGPKLYKRNGYYYIFAPAGGVSTGWQTVLRSKTIYGPYERRIVMDQGSTTINGPHQGAWVDTKTGEHWFLHFQDKEAFGRVVHLQPMKWINDWPVIGEDQDGDGKGQPVQVYKKPKTGITVPPSTIADNDEFTAIKMGLQWQWQANPQEGWAYTTNTGSLRLFSVYQPDSVHSLWYLPNILGQKLPAEEFTLKVKLSFTPKFEEEKVGLILLGMDYAAVSLVKRKDKLIIQYTENKKADKGSSEKEIAVYPVSSNTITLSLKMNKGGICRFGFSENGSDFIYTEQTFKAVPGKWVGAKIGLYCIRNNKTNDAGYAEIDWVRYTMND
jgi:beta-xylosidase